MNAIDTNIFVYSLDRHDAVRRATARQLIRGLRRQGNGVLLWQVLAEFVNVLRSWERQGKLTRNDVHRYRQRVALIFTVAMPTQGVIDTASRLFDTYSLSHWDSMLVAACIEAGVDTLYTEDMGAPRQIETVRLVNPFVP
jgi:predicted nucleic acid-binding protein